MSEKNPDTNPNASLTLTCELTPAVVWTISKPRNGVAAGGNAADRPQLHVRYRLRHAGPSPSCPHMAAQTPRLGLGFTCHGIACRTSPCLACTRHLPGAPCHPYTRAAGAFDDDDDLDEPLLTNGGQMHPRPKNVFALERTYLTWTHMAVTVRIVAFQMQPHMLVLTHMLA